GVLMANEYDVIVIGGGPAGYPAAIRAAQNKLKVACIDEWKNKDGTAVFGGTCTNAGCIPSKALLESSELYHKTKDELGVHGINVSGVSFDVAQMQKRKAGVVKASTGVTALQGHGRLLPGRKVEFTAHDGKKETLSAKHVVLASGSIPTELPSMKFDGKNIIDNWGALDLESVPKKLGVVGAGIIGLELGSVWRRLGSEVVILEALDTFLAVADQGLAKEAARHFKKQGLDIKLGAKVSGAKSTASGVEVTYADASGSRTISVDKLIVCVGRRPFTKDLLADGTGVQIDERGFIKVDDHCKTTAENIWAVGDCVRGPMLAHKAKDEGVM